MFVRLKTTPTAFDFALFERVRRSQRLEDVLFEEGMRLGKSGEGKLVQLAPLCLDVANQSAHSRMRFTKGGAASDQIVREIRRHHRAR